MCDSGTHLLFAHDMVDVYGAGHISASSYSTALRRWVRDCTLSITTSVVANVLDRFAGIDRSASGFEALQAAHDRIPDDKAMERFGAQY